MSALLEREVADYTYQRDQLITAILDFSDWLDRNQGVNADRNLRLLDTAEALKKDRLMLAFVAEFSRGKTELINALFFADYGYRLLPSDAGRTTMCPTEIYHDPLEEPGLRLLPIESRLRPESLASLKLRPTEWNHLRFNPEDRAEVASSLRRLSEVKQVPLGEAQALGLWDEADQTRTVHPDGSVEVPAWRYAMINIPHPLLKSGLTVLDTPGLNALGSEPELTLSAIPGAHAVLFLLATDTGVTKSDLEIWQKHVHRHINYHIAVLNKIDMLWDELKTDEEQRATIHRQLEETAKILKLPVSHVFSVSAQKALVGKIRNNAELLERSGIIQLEQVLSHTIIPARREIVAHAALQEIKNMLGNQRLGLDGRIQSAEIELEALSTLTGKSKEAVKYMHERLLNDKQCYEAAADEFKGTRRAVLLQGDELMGQLSIDELDRMMSEAQDYMESRWTTSGLVRAIRDLTDQIRQRFSKAGQLASNVKNYLNQAGERFHRDHGLASMVIPPLDLTFYLDRIDRLAIEAEEFCKDPANILVEKRFMIRRFFSGVAVEIHKTFALAGEEAQRWLRIAMDPIMVRIMEHKGLLDERLDTLKRTLADMDQIKARIAELEIETVRLQEQRILLEDIAERLGEDYVVKAE